MKTSQEIHDMIQNFSTETTDWPSQILDILEAMNERMNYLESRLDATRFNRVLN